MTGIILLWEAVNSVALSQKDKCECDTCHAAKGDNEAWYRIVAEFFLEAMCIELKLGCGLPMVTASLHDEARLPQSGSRASRCVG